MKFERNSPWIEACIALALTTTWSCNGGGGGGGSSGTTPPPPPPPSLVGQDLDCTYFGGLGNERVQGVWVLHDGNVLVAGETTSDFTQLPQFPQPAQPFYDETLNLSQGHSDAYVAILSRDLTSVLAWTYLGGDGPDRAYFAMEDQVPGENNIWVVGFTSSGCSCSGGGCEAFPVVPPSNCHTTPCTGCGPNPLCDDVFVAKLSSDLRVLKSSLVIGGHDDDTPRGGMWVDPVDGSVYVSGETGSDDFFTTVPGAGPRPTTGCAGGVATYDAFVFKLDNSGQVAWSRCLGGAATDEAFGGVRSDATNHALFVAGSSNSFDIATGVPGFNGLLNGTGLPSQHYDGFVAKLDTADGALTAFTFIGGSATDWCGFNDCLELDSTGRPVIVGLTRSGDLPLAGNPLNDTHSNGPNPPDVEDSNDVFVALFSSDLQSLLYSSYVNRLGPNVADLREEPAGLAVDEEGDIYVSGETLSPGFPVTHDAWDAQFTQSGFNDAFLFALTPGFDAQHPSVLRYSTFFGGDHDVGNAAEEGNRGRSLSIVPAQGLFPGQAILSGQTTTDDFPTATPTEATGTVLFPAWLPGDGRQGFVAFLGVR